jgi:hypothetical protein
VDRRVDFRRKAAAAVEDLAALEVDRYPAPRFLRLAFELRANVMPTTRSTSRSPRPSAASFC